MFAGLLPHDGSAGCGGAAGHGCCRETRIKRCTGDRRGKEYKKVKKLKILTEVHTEQT